MDCLHGISAKILVGASHVSAMGRSTAEKSAVGQPSTQKTALSRFSSRVHPPEFLLTGKRRNGFSLDDAILLDNGDGTKTVATEGQNRNWVLKILDVGSMRQRNNEELDADKEEGLNGAVGGDDRGNDDDDDDDDHDECDVCRVDDDQNELEINRESFLRILRKVSLGEAKLFAKLSYLGNLAYSIPKIKPGNLLKYHGLRFVTSSIQKRVLARKSEKSQVSHEDQEQEAETTQKEESRFEKQKNSGHWISPSAAYRIAASAASYLHSHSKSILPFRSSKTHDAAEGETLGNANADVLESDVASLMATTDSVTAVVAAKEEVKQAVADDLKSSRSSPCEWFVCDDDKSGTRFFVIQGSESLASWQANLLFEPVQFEQQDVLVHRGIYEAAKGIYKQILPEIHAHLESHGKDRSFFRFTGHSLGGSLSLLISLMLLIRGRVPASCLLPVITFGSPCVMCGGDRLLQKLGLSRSHLKAIMMHRDIVPRAFSCNYPNSAAELLKAMNRNFRNHPCLKNQKLLYAPMGELLILQPEEKFSPLHPLLPSGSGLYVLTSSVSDVNEAEKQLCAAKTVFLNSPHPLEILSDHSAYGSEGTIKRDHDMNSYVKSVRVVISQELERIRKAERKHLRVEFRSPLLATHGINAGITKEKLFILSGILLKGRESLKQFGGFVASQRTHLVVVFFSPVRLLFMGVYRVIRSP